MDLDKAPVYFEIVVITQAHQAVMAYIAERAYVITEHSDLEFW
jgi:hypothetical protein